MLTSVQQKRVTISVIVPAYNAAAFLPRCLAPLRAMLARAEIDQIVVIDDCSTDDSPALVAAMPEVLPLRTPHNMGPGAARNLAAERAGGDFLWFVDSDVIVAEDAARVLRRTIARGEVAAIVGSYDDAPGAANFLSQYKNLVHHYYHQRARPDGATFWAGCGAVRRDLFRRLGGFDAQRFRHPSVEDIELGYRIRDAGGRIAFEPALQGKHLKEWRFVNLVHTEVFRRAIPWTRLMLERGGLSNDLNVGVMERVRALVAGLTVLATLAWAFGLVSSLWPVAWAATGAWMNRGFVGFFLRLRGLLFAARAYLFHQFYYLYSSAAFACATLMHRLSERR